MFYFRCWKPIISVRESCEGSSLSSSFRARETAENCWNCQSCRLWLAGRNAAFYFKRIGEDWNSYLELVGDVLFWIFCDVATNSGRLVNFYLSSTMEGHSILSIPGRLINSVMQLSLLRARKYPIYFKYSESTVLNNRFHFYIWMKFRRYYN